ncbi:3-isopropylmalate dehydratase small subunit [Sporomusa aerivorans]|uniref:3-isopropylmalate dehydratase small subunit n=1 Tax=Sporomusa aerivorans TaxID=204936 RepID=UPI00352A0C2A
MKKLTVIKSVAAPWLLPNIDTDIICPMKRILKNLDNLPEYAFEPYRFLNGDGDAGIPDSSFVLNKQEYKSAQIMIVGENFGSGSSREMAPEAIAGMGIRCLIGISFGGIFFKNCFQQGVLPIVLPKDKVEELAQQTLEGEFTVDLYKTELTTPRGEIITFDIEPVRQRSLIEGLDDVANTLQSIDLIVEFQAKDQLQRPWVYQA